MFEDFRLRIFDTVVRMGSFSLAARELGISQPAVSQSMAELERTLGTVLFDRSRNPVRLTPKGEVFRRHADQILYWYDATLRALSEEDGQQSCFLLDLDEDTTVEVSSSNGSLNIRKVKP